jgi:hypothetical protein
MTDEKLEFELKILKDMNKKEESIDLSCLTNEQLLALVEVKKGNMSFDDFKERFESDILKQMDEQRQEAINKKNSSAKGLETSYKDWRF